MITAYVMKELTDSSAYPFSYGNSTWFLNKKHASKIFSYHMKVRLYSATQDIFVFT